MNSANSISKKKAVILSVAGAVILLTLVGIVCFALLPKPSIQFVEFRESDQGEVAIFKITNNSWMPFSFYGYEAPAPFSPISRPPSPYGEYRAGNSPGWHEGPISPCRAPVAFKCHTVSGGSSMEVQMPLSGIPANLPVAFGIRLYRGTAAQMRSATYNTMVEWQYRIGRLLGLPLPDFTWSSFSPVPPSTD